MMQKKNEILSLVASNCACSDCQNILLWSNLSCAAVVGWAPIHFTQQRLTTVLFRLGASHDGTGAETSDPQRPTSLSCSWHTGYLMSYIKKNYLHHVFSGCSLAQMRYTLRRLTVSCWTVKAKKVYNVTRDYPGMVMNITEYCKKSFPFERNVTSDPSTPALKSTCNVRCLFKRFIKVTRMGKEVWEWTLHQSFISALEYTRCAEGKVCIQGRCVTPPEDQPTR